MNNNPEISITFNDLSPVTLQTDPDARELSRTISAMVADPDLVDVGTTRIRVGGNTADGRTIVHLGRIPVDRQWVASSAGPAPIPALPDGKLWPINTIGDLRAVFDLAGVPVASPPATITKLAVYLTDDYDRRADEAGGPFRFRKVDRTLGYRIVQILPWNGTGHSADAIVLYVPHDVRLAEDDAPQGHVPAGYYILRSDRIVSKHGGRVTRRGVWTIQYTNPTSTLMTWNRLRAAHGLRLLPLVRLDPPAVDDAAQLPNRNS